MKFLHTADWHIGKYLNGYSLLDEQWHAFFEIKRIAKEEKVDAIIIAGDLYDRSIPTTEAVNVFNKMLEELNLELQLPIYAVSGNHDGASRLNFATSWLSRHQLHLVTKLEQSFIPIETDEVQIFMLPFFDPIDARSYYGIPNNEIESMRGISQAIERIIGEFVEKFDKKKKQILITHFYVTGRQNENYSMTSETSSIVGGLNEVKASLFADFSYVALGHLHLWQASPDQFIRYAGSPVKFNTKEAQNEKGVYIVDVTSEGVAYNFKVISPQKDLIILEGSFEELTNEKFYTKLPERYNAFYAIKLSLRPIGIDNARQKLSEIYGDIVEFTIMQEEKEDMKVEVSSQAVENNSYEEIISLFYESVSTEELDDVQKNIIHDALQSIRKKDEN